MTEQINIDGLTNLSTKQRNIIGGDSSGQLDIIVHNAGHSNTSERINSVAIIDVAKSIATSAYKYVGTELVNQTDPFVIHEGRPPVDLLIDSNNVLTTSNYMMSPSWFPTHANILNGVAVDCEPIKVPIIMVGHHSLFENYWDDAIGDVINQVKQAYMNQSQIGNIRNTLRINTINFDAGYIDDALARDQQLFLRTGNLSSLSTVCILQASIFTSRYDADLSWVAGGARLENPGNDVPMSQISLGFRWDDVNGIWPFSNDWRVAYNLHYHWTCSLSWYLTNYRLIDTIHITDNATVVSTHPHYVFVSSRLSSVAAAAFGLMQIAWPIKNINMPVTIWGAANWVREELANISTLNAFTYQPKRFHADQIGAYASIVYVFCDSPHMNVEHLPFGWVGWSSDLTDLARGTLVLPTRRVEMVSVPGFGNHVSEVRATEMMQHNIAEEIYNYMKSLTTDEEWNDALMIASDLSTRYRIASFDDFPGFNPLFAQPHADTANWSRAGSDVVLNYNNGGDHFITQGITSASFCHTSPQFLDPVEWDINFARRDNITLVNHDEKILWQRTAAWVRYVPTQNKTPLDGLLDTLVTKRQRIAVASDITLQTILPSGWWSYFRMQFPSLNRSARTALDRAIYRRLNNYSLKHLEFDPSRIDVLWLTLNNGGVLLDRHVPFVRENPWVSEVFSDHIEYFSSATQAKDKRFERVSYHISTAPPTIQYAVSRKLNIMQDNFEQLLLVWWLSLGHSPQTTYPSGYQDLKTTLTAAKYCASMNLQRVYGVLVPHQPAWVIDYTIAWRHSGITWPFYLPWGEGINRNIGSVFSDGMHSLKDKDVHATYHVAPVASNQTGYSNLASEERVDGPTEDLF